MSEDGVKHIKIGWKSLKSQCVCLVAQSCLTPCHPMDCLPPGSSVHGNSPGKNVKSGLPCPPPGNLPNPGSNPGLLHFRWILCHLSHQGSPRILEWVAYHISRGTSQPRNRTRVPCIAGRFFTSLATREAQGGCSRGRIPSVLPFRKSQAS